MTIMESYCSFFLNNEACPHGIKCPYSHDVFQDAQLGLISKQLDCLMGGVKYLDDKLAGVDETLIQLKRGQNMLNAKLDILTEKISMLGASCRSIGIPLSSGNTWGQKVVIQPDKKEPESLISRAGSLSKSNSTPDLSKPFLSSPVVAEGIIPLDNKDNEQTEGPSSDVALDDLKEDIQHEDEPIESVPDL